MGRAVALARASGRFAVSLRGLHRQRQRRASAGPLRLPVPARTAALSCTCCPLSLFRSRAGPRPPFVRIASVACPAALNSPSWNRVFDASPPPSSTPEGAPRAVCQPSRRPVPTMSPSGCGSSGTAIVGCPGGSPDCSVDVINLQGQCLAVARCFHSARRIALAPRRSRPALAEPEPPRCFTSICLQPTPRSRGDAIRARATSLCAVPVKCAGVDPRSF